MTVSWTVSQRTSTSAMPDWHEGRGSSKRCGGRKVIEACSCSDAAVAIGIPYATSGFRCDARLDDHRRPWQTFGRFHLGPDEDGQDLRIVPAIAPGRRDGIGRIGVAAEISKTYFRDVVCKNRALGIAKFRERGCTVVRDHPRERKPRPVARRRHGEAKVIDAAPRPPGKRRCKRERIARSGEIERLLDDLVESQGMLR